MLNDGSYDTLFCSLLPLLVFLAGGHEFTVRVTGTTYCFDLLLNSYVHSLDLVTSTFCFSIGIFQLNN